MHLRKADRYEPAAPPAGGLKQHPTRESSTPHPASGGLSASLMVRNGVPLSLGFAFLSLRRRRDPFVDARPSGHSVFYCSVHVLRPLPSALLSFLRDLAETLTQRGMSSSICSLDLFSVSGVSFRGCAWASSSGTPITHCLTFYRLYVTTISWCVLSLGDLLGPTLVGCF